MNAIVLSAFSGMVMMMSSIFNKNKKLNLYLAISLLLFVLLANIAQIYGYLNIHIDTIGQLEFTKYGLFFNSLALFCALIYLILSGTDISEQPGNSADYLSLIFFVLCGVSILTSFNTLIMFFLGIEILSIPLYILTGSDKKNLKSNEASLKYFLMGSFSTGIMLMGITLIYGGTGSFALTQQLNVSIIKTIPQIYQVLNPLGLLLIFISLLFKVSAAPFHFWTPDVYDGAPSVFTSFMATIVKVASFFAFIHLFENRSSDLGYTWKILITLVIILTMFLGNITALFQQSVKRMLSYSSISQAGFLLFTLLTTNNYSREGFLIYSFAYCLASIGIFSILLKIKDYTYDGYNGLAKSHPLLAFTNTIFLFSLAGIPLTAGFFGKFYLLISAVQSKVSYTLLIFALVFTAISITYYFRLIQSMYFKEGNPEIKSNVGIAFKIGLVFLASLVIITGFYPSIIIHWYFF